MSPGISLPDELSVEIAPEFPKPNGNVFIRLRMYTENLNTANIKWSIGGVKKAEGIGLTSFNARMGNKGSENKIKIDIILESGVSFSKTVTLRPAEIDLLWQSNSYTPPFYRGKALFPPQGEVVITAMPNFYSGSTKIDASTLIYKWTVNDTVLEGQSGYGKNTVRVSGPLLGSGIEAEVLVTDNKRGINSEERIILNPTTPSIIFYKNNPLYGIIFEKAVNGGVAIEGEEINVLASPYHMNIQDQVSLEWQMNGRSASEVTGLSATFRKPAEGSGETFLSLKAENLNKMLQFAENGFNIKYEDN